MSVANEVDNGTLTAAAPAAASANAAKKAWWERPTLFRYGFVALLLIVWQIVGPTISPIFFTYPTKIAVAFYTLTVNGDLPYYLGQSLEVMIYGLSIAILVGIPLAVLMARIRWLDWALDLPINALYATPLVAVVPLLVLWFGIYLKAKIIVVFLFAVFPILIKHTGYSEKIIAETYDFLVKNCIWNANTGLSPKRVTFTSNLMEKVHNIEPGKAPTYDQIVDKSFAEKAIKDLGEWKGPVCPTAAF